MKYCLALVAILAFTACSKETAIYYEYNGTTITRIDRGNEVYLYYGKFDKESFPETFIKAEYSGFNSGLYAYMTFLPNKSVRIIKAAGIFEKNGTDSLLSLYEFNNNYLANKWLDSIQGNYNNTIELSDVLKFEKERNLQNHSEVKAYYPPPD